MKQYLQLGKEILKSAHKGQARELMPDTLSLFGHQVRFNLQEGFPLVTTKEVNFKHIVAELLWFLRGDSNIQFLVDNGCNIWNEDAYNYYVKLCENNKVSDILSFSKFVEGLKGGGIIYQSLLGEYKYVLGDTGKQYPWLWRNWDGIDQILNLISTLTTIPNSRRHIISAWNPTTLGDMALPACHSFVQFNCRPISWEVKLEMANNHPDIPFENLYITEAASGTEILGVKIPQYYLDCQLYQRSGDYFLGVPYNIASYALLTEILCEITDMVPGDFVHTFGDVHIYSTHLSQVETQLQREPRELPKLVLAEEAKREIRRFKDGEIPLDGLLQSMEVEWFTVSNYNPAEPIKGKLSTGLK